MATVAPDEMAPSGDRGIRVRWVGMATNDTLTPYAMRGFSGIAGCVQFSGTFGGATVGLQVSNNGSDWHNISDEEGIDGFTEAAMLEFSTSAQMIRPYISGGTADAVNVDVVLRG